MTDAIYETKYYKVILAPKDDEEYNYHVIIKEFGLVEAKTYSLPQARDFADMSTGYFESVEDDSPPPTNLRSIN